MLIGRDWLAADGDGGRRIDDPSDPVRVEVTAALAQQSVWVIPVLLDHAALPAEEGAQPEGIGPLSRRSRSASIAEAPLWGSCCV